MNLIRLVALGVLGAVACTACGDSSPEPEADAPASTDPPASTAGSSTAASSSPPATSAPATTAAPDLSTALAGRTFLSDAVEGFTLVDGTQVALSFEGTNIGAVAGCNQLSSTWTVEGDVLVVGPMAQTQMACEPATLMDQDTWLASVLTSRPTIALEGDTLTIGADGSTVTLVDEAATRVDLPLEGTTWVVDTLTSGDVATSIPAGGSAPSLVFEDGTVAVDTGCNTGSGPARVLGDTVTFGPIAMTRMACTDPVATAAEPQVLVVLRGTATTRIEGDVLTLRNGSDGLVAHAGTTASEDGLVGPTWNLGSATVDDADVPVGDRVPTLTFDGTSVAVDTGCNTGGGGYTADATTITFQPLISTLIACEGPTATMESTITGALTGTVPFEIGADGALTITNGATTLRYVAS
jgi:heat shock protein HslJ